MNIVKKYAKDTFALGVTGVGIGALSSVNDDSGSAEALGKLGKGVGTVGSIAAYSTSMSILTDPIKKMKRF